MVANPALALMVTVCGECGKRCYSTTRRDAKVAGRAVDRACRPYRCGDWWHFGHLPKVVLVGEYDRRRVRAMRGRAGGDQS